MLQLKQITKDYIAGTQIVHALKGINVDFRKNEFVSVLGPSGCGKTTLMNIIGGLDKYTSGDLCINGKSTKQFRDLEWDNYRNKKIGFVFQSYNLIPHLNVFGNVEIALTVSGISKEERNKRTRQALEEVGLLDQINQKPNQLSGGQMQRVAIARALVNSPEILLADEPTGALDTATSEQIMELIKKISKDKLVIMVTHNPELAERYSTRLIKMVDGKITEDSNPYHAEGDIDFTETVEQAKATSGKPEKSHTAMSYTTALSLSGKNLITKKGRTLLTSIAGSIGIIGIALVLALSGGLNNYIANLQRDTLASNPITITETTIDMNQAMTAMGNREVFEEFPDAKEIYVEKAMNAAEIMTHNNITQEYITYIQDNLNASWYNDISYKTGLTMNFYGQMPGQTTYSKLKGESSSSNPLFGSSSNWQMLLKSDFINSQYEVLEGTYPSNKNEIVIIVGKSNEISDDILIELGIKSAGDDVKKYQFSDVLGKEFKIVSNDLMYEKTSNNFSEKSPLDIDFAAAETIKITGILRIKESTEGGVLSTGIGYLNELYTWMQTENGNSEMVEFMREEGNSLINPLTGVEFQSSSSQSAETLRAKAYRSFGGESLANEISIYPTSFDAKESIRKVLNDYNTGREKDDMVTYTDMSELLGESLSTMVDVISYVLIAFAAISLVVSSIMIAIITYISVLERIKEIGVLRSIGARKKDITRVFNAETIIIGFVAGLIGVLVTYLLSIPINIIIYALLGISGIASLNIGYAALLVAISVVLTLVSGLIPARNAAKQDPVQALRTE